MLAVAACMSTLAPGDLQRTHRSAPVEGAVQKVGAEECLACHEEVAGHAPAPSYHADCEACHDTGHRTLLEWTRSEHQRSGVFCTDCHSAHEREPWNLRRPGAVARAISPHAGDVTRLCSSCHPEVAASFALPSHHPLREGMLGCTDCHAPHGERIPALGAATALCAGCHQDYAGPWIYEHAPVTEDCGYCHAPHGASSRALLATNEPGVCISCHTVAESGAVHDPLAFATRCSDCHSAVHGSYADPHLRR